ncbi:hypothetical protein BGZ51_001044 [Haplosporangium sp. Z 767]|nr:hypothetical protein BGZ50_008445 [Haplosporangium sp. Z 11]KAF9187760.1 hypothetical protein BGZ51_001044 [Haplosporangium sp. Z 767]
MANSSDRDKLDRNSLDSLKDMVKNFELKHDPMPELEEPLNTFRHLESMEALCDLLRETYPKMQTRNHADVVESELGYVWNVFETMRNLWCKEDLTAKWKEGWFTSNIHGPILQILRTIGKTEYRLTDIKGTAAALTGIDLRHDSILHHTILKLDLVVMEAKSTNHAAGRLCDLKKVEKALTANLQLAIKKLPDDHRYKRKHVRSHAILCSGFEIKFLEARLHEPAASEDMKRMEKGRGIVLVYSVGKAVIPTSVSVSYKLTQSLKAIIAFKRRVQANVDWLSQAKHISSDLASSVGSSGSVGVVV